MPGHQPLKHGTRPPWVGLAAAVLVQTSAGNAYNFPLYSPALKSVMGYNQPLITFLGVANDVGENVGLIPGIACNRFPPWLVLLVGVLSATLFCGLLLARLLKGFLIGCFWRRLVDARPFCLHPSRKYSSRHISRHILVAVMVLFMIYPLRIPIKMIFFPSPKNFGPPAVDSSDNLAEKFSPPAVDSSGNLAKTFGLPAVESSSDLGPGKDELTQTEPLLIPYSSGSQLDSFHEGYASDIETLLAVRGGAVKKKWKL